MTTLRLAWFSPLPPVRSGVASYTAELVPLLQHELAIDCFPESRAHDFIWQHRRAPYDLVVYQLGNAPFHDYMWPYLVAYPGLVVLHDPRLHHARARQLLSQKRFDHYRHEFWFDHPDATRDFVEYAIEGLGGPIYYFWSMLRVLMNTARVVAVHSERVADELRASFPEAIVRAIPLGKAPLEASRVERQETRADLGVSKTAVVFAVFGKLTPEKRIAPILRAFAATVRDGVDAWLWLVGDAAAYPSLAAELQELAIAERVRVTGHVSESAIGMYLEATDVCLCLRWPTALETSAAWLHCLAAGRPTVITDLAHLVDVPTIDPRHHRAPAPLSTEDPPRHGAVAVRIDLLDEDHALRVAMRTLATDVAWREALASAGHAYWLANHTIELTAARYRDVVHEAAARPAPVCTDVPRHFMEDYTELTRRIANHFGISDAVSFLRW
jgi:glycosyltransferase involved in cell wall biosynthesis